VNAQPQIFDYMSALADGLRSRILLLLERQELTVTELCAVMQLPQSTVSRHLKTLSDGGWVASRKEGTRRLYGTTFPDLDRSGRSLWRMIREQAASTAAARQDARRLPSVLARRRHRSRRFFEGSADSWDRVRDDLFGERFYLFALMGLIAGEPEIADLGCGTGFASEALAPIAGRVTAIDGSGAMLEAARARLAGFENVDLIQGDLEHLPIRDHSVDAATLILVLHHVTAPEKVLAEVARILRPNGRLLLLDMLPHDRLEYQRKMGHVWMGFSREQTGNLLSLAGLAATGYRPLRPEVDASGPNLFAVTASRLAAAPRSVAPPAG